MSSEQSPRERFPALSDSKSPVDMERAVLDYWEREGVFAATQTPEEEASKEHFVFYEGPPTANGDPGVHHIITRLAKDTICRYQAMNGRFVLRKAGWDTHGLPVELEVQKKLGLATKDDIEKFGIGEFNRICRESVFKYEKEWREMTRRIGYWLDLDDPYITCTTEYVESVWWLLKQMWDGGLIYEGHKVMPYNPRLGTVYSSHEVAQGYEEVEDPSITVRFCMAADPSRRFLVWTTTPWTLLSNVALALHPELEYSEVRLRGEDDDRDETLILATARLDAVLEGHEYEIVGKMKGSDLAGLRYERLYDYVPFGEGKRGAELVLADFVSAEDGTGIVHMAPAYGADDYEVGKRHGLAFLTLVGEDGKVVPEATPFAGLDFKAADPKVIEDLKVRGLLWSVLVIKHSYPHCWRDKGPLMYFAQPGWFIETTKLKERFLAANAAVEWTPAEVGAKRFGDWLEGNIDWALSRDRYWGTPLPVWKTESGKTVCIGSLEELRSLAVDPPDEIDPHKPMVDELELRHPETGEPMRRVRDVIDAWFDSGAMPFAQWHYPFENKERFESQFPADFICEAIDQSRGWFYSLLAISVFARDTAPYKRVLVTGHVVDKKGKKMSKSLGNIIDPFELLDRDGADAIRLYMATASPLWGTLKFDVDGPREMNSKMLGTLRNSYAFFALYANLDGWEPGGEGAAADPSLLDRWLRSRYETLVLDVRNALDNLDLTRGAKAITHFVIEELSNWYVRRSRRRFWRSDSDSDKMAAYATLHHCLVTLSKLMAPFAPFITEEIYTNLMTPVEGAPESVHLADFPVADESLIDEQLNADTRLAMRLSSLGRSVRSLAKIKVRQPLPHICIKVGRNERDSVSRVEPQLLDELNVEQVKLVDSTADLGENYVVTEDSGYQVAVPTEIPQRLLDEGLAREVVHRLQNLRKGAGFEIADRILVWCQGDDYVMRVVIEKADYIVKEVLANIPDSSDFAFGIGTGAPPEDAAAETCKLSGHEVKLAVKRAD
jgi:isoleucyl-tRNA synthetase